jgi:hypothetical protein
MTMKPYDLVVGDRFKVAASEDPEEMEDIYEVMEIETKSISMSTGKTVVTAVSITAKLPDGSVGPLGIGPWVEVTKL